VAGSATGGCGDFGVVLCAGHGGVCVGLREGRHLMPVAAGVVVLLFTAQLEEAIYPVWSCS
jgi:hypothetical protein